MGESRASQLLATALDQEQEAILTSWLDAVLRLPDSHYREHPRGEVISWLRDGFSSVAEFVRSGSRRGLDAHINRIGRVRRELGFGIDEVIESLLLLREAALPWIWKALSDPDARVALPLLDECLRGMVAAFASRYANLMRESLERARDRTEIILDTSESVARSQDRDVAIQCLASGIATAMGGAYSAAYLPDSDTTELGFHAEAGTSAVRGLKEGLRRTIRDKALIDDLFERQTPRVMSADDLGRSLDLGPGELQISTAVAFPVLASDQLLAVVIAVSPKDGRSFTDLEVELGGGIANTVAPVLDNARLLAETRLQLAESRSLQQVVTALLDKVGLGGMMNIVCREAQDLTGAEGSAIFLLDESDHLGHAHSSGLATSCADQLLAFVAKPLLDEPVVADVSSGLETGVGDMAGITSLLAMPLRGHDRNIGVLLLVNTPGSCSPGDTRVCGLFADQAAIAIEHEGLHEQEQRMAVLEERQKLAQDLHDSVSQSIYGVTMFAEAAARLLEAQRAPEATEILRELRDTAQEALRDMRLLIFELRPAALEKQGLVGALKVRLGSVEGRAGLTTDLQCEGIGRLPTETEEGLHRIAQEALNNVLKHAHASRVSVTLRRVEGDIVLEINDNGVGFDVDKERAAGGLGLRGLEERSARLGGRVVIEGRPGSGTRVKVTVPASGKTHR